MILKSYAKLNLTLSVNKKLKIGLHSIQSIYCLIDLYDKISVKKIMQVNLTADHRVIYGADGASFLKDLANLIENEPETLVS